MLVLKQCGNQRVDGVERLRFDVRTGLKADEAEWKKRDVHTRHETATLEIGKAVAWHYAPVGKPGELWFRFGVIVDIIGGKLKEDKAGKNSNPDVNLTLRAFDPPLRYPLNESDLKDKFIRRPSARLDAIDATFTQVQGNRRRGRPRRGAGRFEKKKEGGA